MRNRIKKAIKARLAPVRAILQKHGDELLFAAALAVLAAVLFRPGAEAEKAVTQITAPKLTFTQWWRDDLEDNTLEDLIREFESLHDIKIVPSDTRYEDLRRSLFNPGETPPGDILALDPLWVPELTKRGIVEDAGTPLLSFINVLFYNIPILKDAGFIRPPKNRGEFLAYAKAAAAEETRRGLAVDKNSSRMLYEDVYSWIWAAGAQIIKDGKPALDSRPFVECLAFLAALNKEGLIAPGAFSAAPSGGAGTKLDDFVSGKAAFMIAPARDIRHVRERMGDSAFGVSSVPPPDAAGSGGRASSPGNYAGRPFFGTAAWSLGVYSESAYKEEAKLFMAFLAEKAPVLSEKARAVPGNAAVPPGTDPFYSKVWDIAIAGESAQDFSGIAGKDRLEEIFREELTALFAGESTPEESAAAIQERWEAVFAETQP